MSAFVARTDLPCRTCCGFAGGKRCATDCREMLRLCAIVWTTLLPNGRRAALSGCHEAAAAEGGEEAMTAGVLVVGAGGIAEGYWFWCFTPRYMI
jgi:hypothetical protein